MKYPTDDLRITDLQNVSAPEEILEEFPLTEAGARTVFEARAQIREILQQSDDRLMVIVGPCSIHDVEAAHEYAQRLQPVRDRLAEDLLIVMRVYFEKPRTTVGWKGLINDPDLDDSYHINQGLRLARGLLVWLGEQGLPAGTEFLDLITPQYVADSVSWGAIGARTTESQCHRELASGLSCPVGFKNGTSGDIQVAVDALRSSTQPHCFLSLTKEGRSAIFHTTGNEDSHVIMRGGQQPNFEANAVEEVCARLEQAKLPVRVMIDCSHANSRKVPEQQMRVADNIGEQIRAGDRRVVGVMVESHLVGGNQKLVPGEPLQYGQSITDACLGFEQTEQLLEGLAEAVRTRRKRASRAA